MQTRKGSILEVALNMLTGFLVSWCLTYWFFPAFFQLHLSGSEAWWITFTYTVVSVIRSYIWRRVFNHFIVKKEQQQQ